MFLFSFLVNETVTSSKMMCGVAALLMLTCNALAQSPTRLVANMQDETPPLPKDNTAMITPDDRSIELRLARLTDQSSMLDSSSLATLEAETHLFSADGDEIEFETTEDGKIKVNDIGEGLHVLIAQTAKSMASIAFIVEETTEKIEARDRTVAVPMMLDGAETARGVKDMYLAKNEVQPNDLSSVQFQTTARHDYSVRLTGDGRLVGKVMTVDPTGQRMSLAANNNVFLLRNGVRIDNSVSDAKGAFEFRNLAPGVYGIVAAGPGGYTAFAFEATDQQLVLSEVKRAGFVVEQAAGGDVLPVVMIPPEAINRTIDIIESGSCIVDSPVNSIAASPAPPAPAPGAPLASPGVPAPAGGFGGFGGAPIGGTPGFTGGGGGGGGAFGGGNIGALASAAGVYSIFERR